MTIAVTTTTFAGAGTYNLSIPSPPAGNYLYLSICANQAPPIATPSGWAADTSFRFSAPILRTFTRTRVAGDSSVSFTVSGEGSAILLSFPVPLAGVLSSFGSAPTNPTTLVHDAGSDPGKFFVAVAWTTATGYIDTGDFSRVAIASRAGYTQSVYISSTFGDSSDFEDTVGTFRYFYGYSYDKPGRWWLGVSGWSG